MYIIRSGSPCTTLTSTRFTCEQYYKITESYRKLYCLVSSKYLVVADEHWVAWGMLSVLYIQLYTYTLLSILAFLDDTLVVGTLPYVRTTTLGYSISIFEYPQ